VINARDAMPGGGRIRIGLEDTAVGAAPHDVRHAAQPEDYVRLSVSDSGLGMDRETAGRIFEPFFTTKDFGRGTGLGLAIVYTIVQNAGGMIDVDTAVGRGTTFHIYLPRTAENEEPEPSPASLTAPAAAPSTPAGTVLLAEDDYGLRTLIHGTLQRAGYTVLHSSSAEEAVEVARAHRGPIHVLIADVVMPGMNGRKLADHVREFRDETRLLFMSGYSDDTVERAGVRPGSAQFIQKPFSMDALLKKVQETLNSTAVH
jgi:two-component system cell cycle sensor histidine kinase/response regulator CckA